MKKKYAIIIQGKRHEWSFITHINPKYLNEWREDGVVLEEIVNTIPLWVNEFGLTRPWVFLQDLFNFKNPFAK